MTIEGLAALIAANREATPPVVTAQVRTSYARGGWGKYGRAALIAHLDGKPRWAPIRDTATARVLAASEVAYAGTMARSQVAHELMAMVEAAQEAGITIAGTYYSSHEEGPAPAA